MEILMLALNSVIWPATWMAFKRPGKHRLISALPDAWGGRMKLKVLLTLAAACLSSAVQAAAWVEIAKGPDSVLSIDLSSFALHDGMAMIWRKLEFSSPHTLNGTLFQFRSEKNLSILNCAAKTVANKEEVFYDMNGNVITAFTIPNNHLFFSEIAPDSVAEIEYNFVCRRISPQKSPHPRRYIL